MLDGRENNIIEQEGRPGKGGSSYSDRRYSDRHYSDKHYSDKHYSRQFLFRHSFITQNDRTHLHKIKIQGKNTNP